MNSKITAFVLNELPENERAAFLAELENDSALQHEIRETQDFCDLLQHEIGTQNAPSLTEDQHAALASAFANPQPVSVPQPSNVRRFPFRILVAGIGTLAAAYAIISQLPEQGSQKLAISTDAPQSSEDKDVNNTDKVPARAPKEPLVLAGGKNSGSGSGGGIAAPTTPVPSAPKVSVATKPVDEMTITSELMASTFSDTRQGIPPQIPAPSARQNLPRPGSQQPANAPSLSSKAAADSQMGYIKADAPAGALGGLSLIHI
jgi:hypothetical protein